MDVPISLVKYFDDSFPVVMIALKNKNNNWGEVSKMNEEVCERTVLM